MKYLIHFKNRQTPVLSENSCFYKSDTSQMDSIPIEELTITLVTGKYPRKLIHHLKTKLRYQVKKAESGIYYVTGDKIPIQIIVTKELTEAENLWLKSLTNELEQNETAEKLLEEYSKNQANALYRSVMELIVRANKQKFEEVKGMCDALRELIGSKVKEMDGEVIAIEIMPDHVHLFVEMPPSVAPAQIAFRLKGYTAHELRAMFPRLKSRLPSLWSRSYYVGTAGHVSEETIKKYIAAQKRSPRSKG